jgi:ribosomal-protein-alanine N-acetyltransferase
MIYELHKDELRILNLAVAPEVRRSGIGSTMVNRLIAKLTEQRRRVVSAVIDERNLDGQLFLSACGLQAVELLKGHYGIIGEPDRDAIRFEYRIGGVNRIRGFFGE